MQAQEYWAEGHGVKPGTTSHSVESSGYPDLHHERVRGQEEKETQTY